MRLYTILWIIALISAILAVGSRFAQWEREGIQASPYKEQLK